MDDWATSLQQRLISWMDTGACAWPSFDRAAREIFSYQFERNHSYRRYVEALGKSPSTVTSWEEIPALPTDAFKFPHLPLRTFSEEEVTHHFLTSGTTCDTRGVHEFADLSLYLASIRGGWKALHLPAITQPWFMSQASQHMQESSLAMMFQELSTGHSKCWLIDAHGNFQASRFRKLLKGTEPVQLFATALALLRFTEYEERCPLPPGSWIFETGGYKGLRITLDPTEFRTAIATHFEIPVGKILNEYSMTELSSQCYRWPDELGHRCPPWMCVRVVDPETGKKSPANTPGYLEIFDLANLGSVLAIRTQDIAIARSSQEFTLLGRDPSALPRGCSRASDNLYQ